MKHLLILGFLILSVVNCTDSTIDDLPNTIDFGDKNLQRFPHLFVRADDAHIQEDGSLFIIGLGSEDDGAKTEQFLLRLNPEAEVINFRFLNIENRGLYLATDLLSLNDGHQVYLTSASEQNSFLDISLQKLNALGATIWSKQYGEKESDEHAVSVVQGADGSFLVLAAGDWNGNAYENYRIIKVQENGDLAWIKTINDSQITAVRQIIISPIDSSLIVLTEIRSLEVYAHNYAKLTKLDKDGNIIPTQMWTSNSIIKRRSSNLTTLSDGSILLYFAQCKAGSEDDTQIEIINLNQELMESQRKSYGEIRSNTPSDVIETNDGNMILLSTSSTIGLGQSGIVLTKLNLNGDVIWRRFFGTESRDYAVKVLEKDSGNLVIVGNTNHDNSEDRVYDLFIVETDRDGVPK